MRKLILTLAAASVLAACNNTSNNAATDKLTALYKKSYDLKDIPTAITVIAYWIVGLPLCYLLGFSLKLEHIGIWIGLTLSLMVSAGLLSWRFYKKANAMKL